MFQQFKITHKLIPSEIPLTLPGHTHAHTHTHACTIIINTSYKISFKHKLDTFYNNYTERAGENKLIKINLNIWKNDYNIIIARKIHVYTIINYYFPMKSFETERGGERGERGERGRDNKD